jgi:folate-binding protein YgfZ
MEINEAVTLEDSGYIEVSGSESKDFLQNIVTNDLEKVTSNSTVFSSIFTPQGKYLFEFFIIKIKNDYLIECEKKIVDEIIKLLKFYKLRSKVDFKNVNEKYKTLVISLEKFKEINKSKAKKGQTILYNEDPLFVDPRSERLGAKVVLKSENLFNVIENLNLKIIDKKKYYTNSFELGIPQINLGKLKEKIFGIENNLDELNGIDFKKGCYIGQENTSRIKLRNKLRRRVLPIKIISGEISENEIVKYKNNEIGKILISQPYIFALVKVVEPDLKEFIDTELICGNSKVRILKPDWM